MLNVILSLSASICSQVLLNPRDTSWDRPPADPVCSLEMATVEFETGPFCNPMIGI